ASDPAPHNYPEPLPPLATVPRIRFARWFPASVAETSWHRPDFPLVCLREWLLRVGSGAVDAFWHTGRDSETFRRGLRARVRRRSPTRPEMPKSRQGLDPGVRIRRLPDEASHPP